MICLKHMWLARFVYAPQFFKTPKGLCGHTVRFNYNCSLPNNPSIGQLNRQETPNYNCGPLTKPSIQSLHRQVIAEYVNTSVLSTIVEFVNPSAQPLSCR
jgi:hypothetical protein